MVVCTSVVRPLARVTDRADKTHLSAEFLDDQFVVATVGYCTDVTADRLVAGKVEGILRGFLYLTSRHLILVDWEVERAVEPGLVGQNGS
jgi:hypothetical protein